SMTIFFTSQTYVSVSTLMSEPPIQTGLGCDLLRQRAQWFRFPAFVENLAINMVQRFRDFLRVLGVDCQCQLHAHVAFSLLGLHCRALPPVN
ncbi:MAG TPA: hypothetical protein VHT52_10450, partial [Stellaceae bacterium]|nr:hypothetical protein [Stellaceae bacterium]